jgi:hypothetical protein
VTSVPESSVHQRDTEGHRDLSVSADGDQATTATQGFDHVQDPLANSAQVSAFIAHPDADLVRSARTKVRLSDAGA